MGEPGGPRRRRVSWFIAFLPLGLLRLTSLQAFTPPRGYTRSSGSARFAGTGLYRGQGREVLASEGERIYGDVDPASLKVSPEDGYVLDDSVFTDDKPEDIGPVHYYGVTDAGQGSQWLPSM